KEHIDMNPEKIVEQNQDTYRPTYVDPDCYYEEADAIKEVQEDTAYLCLHFTKDHEGNKIQYAVSRKDQYAVFKPYGNKIFWKISNVVPTPRNPQYAVSKTLDTSYRPFSRPYK
ncbi:hypothetical protein Tco_0887290, partial [Tanacetum coccineum]